MIRYMVTGLTAASLCVAPVANAKGALFDNASQNPAKQNKKPDLVSAWDIAPLFLFGGSVLYMYSVKKQCNTIEQELKNQNSRMSDLEKRLKNQFRHPFPDEDDMKASPPPPRDGFDHSDYHVVPSPKGMPSSSATAFSSPSPTLPTSSLSSNLRSEPATNAYPDINRPPVSSSPAPTAAQGSVSRPETPNPFVRADEPESDGNGSDFSDLEGEGEEAKKAVPAAVTSQPQSTDSQTTVKEVEKLD